MMGADMFAVPIVLPAIAADLGCSIAVAAQIVVVYGAAYALSSPFVTGLLQTQPGRRVILTGMLLVVCAAAVCAGADGIGVLVIARCAAGVGAAVVNPAVWTRLQETASPSGQSRVTLGGTAVSATGQLIGLPVAAVVAQNAGWRMVFAVIGAGFALVWVLIRTTVPAEPRSARAERIVRDALGAVARGISLWRLPEFSLAVVANVGAQAARLGIYSYVTALLALRYPDGRASPVTVGIVAGAGSLAGALLATAAVTRWRRRGLPTLGLGVAASAVLCVGIAMIALPVSSTLNLTGIAVSFACGIVVFGSGQAELAATFAGDRTAVSWNSSALYVGAAVGTSALGWTPLGTAGFVAVPLSFALGAAWCFALCIRVSRREAGSTSPRFSGKLSCP